MGANPETFEKKARSASSTADSPPERHLIATAEGDVESFSPRSPPTLRYYAARMTSRLNQAPLDIVWLMLCRMVKLCVIVPGSGSFSLMLTVFGDAEGTIVELMGFPTFIGAYHVRMVFEAMNSSGSNPYQRSRGVLKFPWTLFPQVCRQRVIVHFMGCVCQN